MRNNKKNSSSKLIIIFLIGFIIYISYTLYQQETQLKMLNMQREELIKTREEKQNKIKELHNQIDNADSPEYVEKYARETLKMVKDDETVYVDLNKKSGEKER